MITNKDLIETLSRLPDPKTYNNGCLRVPLMKPSTILQSIDSMSPIGYIEELLFIRSSNRENWILKEITTGGISVSLPDEQ